MFPTVDGMFKSTMLSDRLHKGTGWHTSQQTEYCLLWKRGKPGSFEVRLEDQVVFDLVREHSRKPDRVRNVIERAYPNAKRIEVFAREKVDGWDAWGNEVGIFRRFDQAEDEIVCAFFDLARAVTVDRGRKETG